MITQKGIAVGFFITILLGSNSPALADLIVYEKRLVYDTHNEITWLRDAKYSYSANYDNDGLMTHPQAMEWVSNLVYLGIDGWRLPETVPSNDKFYQIASEMGHVYYVELENEAYYFGFDNPGPFFNLDVVSDVNSSWWSETKIAGDPNGAWVFNWFTGAQDGAYIGELANAWAVHEGNVGEVLGLTVIPEPTTMLLIGSGLIGLVGFRRRFRKGLF